MRSQPVAGFSKRMKSITGPPRILWRSHHVCTKRVQLDVSQAVVPIALVLQNGGTVAFVPYRTRASVFAIEIVSVTNADYSHRPCERTILCRRDDEVIVRRHERVGIDVDAVTPGGSDDDAHQVLVIVLVADDGAAVDAARKYMDAEI